MSLNEKIKKVFKLFLISTLIYILVSLLLLNHYSFTAEFDARKVYDVVKDALTLAAAFLAPIVAFILFNDWRVQFNTEVKHRVTTKMFDLKFQLLRMLAYARNGEISTASGVEDGNEEAEKFFILCKEFENNIEEVKRLCGESEYTINTKSAIVEFHRLWGELVHQDALEKHVETFESKAKIREKQSIEKMRAQFDSDFTSLQDQLKLMDEWGLDKLPKK